MRSFLIFDVIFISCIIAALGKPDVETVEESTTTTPPPLVGMESKEVDWTQFLKDLEAQSESSERTATPPLIEMEVGEIDWSKFHEDLGTQLKGAEDANEEEAAVSAMKTKAGKKTVKKTSPPKTAKAGKATLKVVGTTDASTERTTSLSSSNTNTRVTGGLRSADTDVLSTSKPSGFWLLISLASLVVVLVVVKYVWKV